jgi:hypothetical protein
VRYLIFLIEAGVFVIALYFLTRYVAMPVIQYIVYMKKREAKAKPKTKEELDRELELAQAKKRLDKMHFERSDELSAHLDSIFDEARRHRPGRRRTPQ